ncbi:MAG: hypothetical protein Q7N50_03810 [Armatimonadota bacterium]|nr:hypothetical protein [Armatimonadota bacterium]
MLRLLASIQIACLSFVVLAGPSMAASVGKGKKLLEFGWNTPNIEYLRDHGAELDKNSPFDGVITAGAYVSDGHKRDFSWVCFGSERISPDAAEKWIADMKAARLKRMTHNFIRFNTMPGNVDWFDDFGAIQHNAKLLARVAKRGGFKGILLDFEEYSRKQGVGTFTYPYQKYKDKKTFDDYTAQVKLRGREFGKAISSEFPNAVLLMTHSHSWPYDLMPGQEQPLSEVVYGLLPAFIDGMLEGCSPRTTLVDAFEASYGYREKNEFMKAREMIKEAAAISSNQEMYKKRIGVGFGLCLDYPSPKGSWNPSDININYFLPDEFEYAAFCAQAAADKYVWIYTERPNWWTGEKLPPEYMRALVNSRNDHEYRRARRRSLVNESAKEIVVSSKTTPGSDDKSAFGDLWKDYEEVLTLDKVWKFALDPNDIGLDQKWFMEDFDASGWKDIEIGEWWEPQGYRYDGVAWYRSSFRMPVSMFGRRVWLAFGAVDDAALVYINGKQVGERDPIARGEFAKRFLMEISGRTRFGKENTIVVRVMDRRMLGGIWKSVKIITDRKPE